MKRTVHPFRAEAPRFVRAGLCARQSTIAVAVLAAVVLLAALPRRPAAAAPDPTVPQPRGYVSDYVGVLDPSTVQQLAALIGELKQKTGAEIAVVVVQSTAPLEAFDYAMKIAEAWKPGAAGKDNGIVFLVAVKDRKVYILTGYGVEGALPDGKVGEIRDRLVVPAFKRQDYAGGIRAATREMAEQIAADRGVQLTGASRTPAGRRRPQGGLAVFWVILIVVIVLYVMSHSSRGVFGGRPGVWRRGGGWGGSSSGGIGGGGFGGGFGGSGGGFGGFGGGGFGGGGAGGSW